MHVRLQPPQPRGLVGELVERFLDGHEFGADCGDDAAQFYPRLPFLFLQRQDSLRMTLDLGIGQNIRQFRFTHRFLLRPTMRMNLGAERALGWIGVFETSYVRSCQRAGFRLAWNTDNTTTRSSSSTKNTSYGKRRVMARLAVR